MPGGAVGQQHLRRAHRATAGVHAVRLARRSAAAEALETLHAGAGVDLRTAALGRLRQAVREAAHVHLAAALVEQSADETLACDLGLHACCVQDLHVGVHTVSHEPVGASRQRLQVRRARRQLELAASREVAVDRLVADDALHRVDPGVERVVPGARALHPHLGSHLGIVDREPVVDVPAIAPGGLGSDTLPRLEDDHRGAALRQRPCRRQAREAAAHDRDVALRRQIGRARHEGRRAGGPVRLELHGSAG